MREFSFVLEKPNFRGIVNAVSQQSSPQQSEVTLHAIDYWQVVKNRYGIILLSLLLVFMTAAVITYLMPRKFESTASVEVKPKVATMTPVGPGEFDGSRLVTANFFNTEFEKIKSQKVLMRVVEKLQLNTNWSVDKDTAVAILKSIIKTQNRRGTDLIDIQVRHEEKDIARDVADEVSVAYKDYRESSEREDAAKKLLELAKAVNEQEDDVAEKRKTVTTIARTKNIVDSMFERTGGLNEDQGAQSSVEFFYKIEQEKMQLDSQIKNLESYQNEELIAYAANVDLPDNVIKVLYPQYLEAGRQLDTLKLGGLGRRHPTILQATENISGLRADLERGVVNLKSTLRNQLEMTTAQLKAAELKKSEAITDARDRGIDAQDYVDAKTQLKISQELLQSLKLKKIGEEIALKIPPKIVEITDEPVLPEVPVSPNVMLNLVLGGVVGLIFGIGIAFFLEYLDTSVKSLEDVERYLNVPVLAVIPKDVGVLHKQSGMSPDAEAYRILRTNIEFNRKNPEDNAITVVSGGAGEGKSTTLVNLAYICAQGGYTTLMIDADLRRPRLHTFFDINNSVGLTNYLTTDLKIEDVILQTPVDNLYFMPSGILPADAAGILNSRRMSELIQDVKQRFDLVLVDSPPILGVSDASVLASEVDLTMLVVQHRKLPRNMLLRVKQAVENVGGTVLGVVLNNVDVRSDSQYQYYTSYYTYYAPAETSHTPAAAVASSRPAAKSGEDLY